MHARAAQVAVDQQRPFALLGMRGRQIRGRGGLAFARRRAGHQQGPVLPVEAAEQNRVPQRANRLVEPVRSFRLQSPCRLAGSEVRRTGRAGSSSAAGCRSLPCAACAKPVPDRGWSCRADPLSTAAPIATSAENRNASSALNVMSGNTGLQRRPGRIGDADRAVLEARR